MIYIQTAVVVVKLAVARCLILISILIKIIGSLKHTDSDGGGNFSFNIC